MFKREEAFILRDENFKTVYRTGKDNLYTDFYSKALSLSVKYSRAVGYFSAELLSMNIKGLSRLISSKGKMNLLIGHPLSPEEFDAVKQGMKLQVYSSELGEKLEHLLLKEREKYPKLEILTWLIANGNLEVKFALRKAGMYHEKIGIFEDEEENKVVFCGSANETPHGMLSSLNAESITVYKSWETQIFDAYATEFIDGFDRLWNNEDEDTITLAVPSKTYEDVSKKYVPNQTAILSFIEFEDEIENNELTRLKQSPMIPSKIGDKEFSIYLHQKNALKSWQANSYKGIFKLATGSGKTITSIYGAVKLYEAKQKKNQKLFLIIAVPYVELAEQWIEILDLFNISAHRCFNNKSSWYDRLKNQVNTFNLGSIDFVCAVVVNRTLSSVDFQELVNGVESSFLMIIGDECHNHGSKLLNDSLPNAYYRIGLSATPFRSDEDEVDSPFPDDAKKRIISYYGDICCEYSLGDAINDGVLTPYKYHIIPVYLTQEEQDKYEEISFQISQILIRKNGSGLSTQDRENLTRYCGLRSRLLGSAANKLESLKELTSKIEKSERTHSLFYSGEGSFFNSDNSQEKRVIDEVATVLTSNEWKVSKFTSGVNKKDRSNIMSAFKDETVEGLIAMKVLDEGIDVPACKTAYILASTKNPRQYVQRRGRILRKAPNKKSATIYDFVVLPINDSPSSKRLKLSEAERVNDFALLALNKFDIEQKIDKYGLSYDIF